MSIYLVTGGAGFIGSHLVEALVAQSHSVRVLDDLSSGSVGNLAAVRAQIDFIEGSIQDQDTVRAAMAGVEVVFHLAGMVSVPQSLAEPVKAEMINTVGTLNLLEAAKLSRVRRLILSSTCAVYGDEPTLPKTEAMATHPTSPYAISKLAAENYCRFFYRSFGLETVVLRYFNVFGPRQDPSSPYSGVISIFIDKLLQGKAPTIFGDGQQTRDFVFVTDIVQANLLAAQSEQAAGELFNIGTGRPVTINQLFDTLARIGQVQLKPRYQPPRPGDIRHSYGDATQAQTVLGWFPQVDLESGLRQTVSFLTA